MRAAGPPAFSGRRCQRVMPANEVRFPLRCADMVRGRRWRFVLQELGNGHWVSVARGPPEDIVDAWQARPPRLHPLPRRPRKALASLSVRREGVNPPARPHSVPRCKPAVTCRRGYGGSEG